MYAQGQVGAFVAGHGHFAGFRLDFVAQRGNGFDHARAGAIRAGLAKHALESLLGALASDAHQAEFVEAQRFRRRFIFFEGLLQREQNFVAVAALFHVDEVDHDNAAQIAQANLAHDFLHRFQIGFDDGVFQPRGTLADEFAGVDIDGHQRFGVVDDDVAAGLEPHFGAQSFVEFVLDAELFKDGRFLGVQLDAADQLGLEAADEFDDLAEFFFAVDPDGCEIVADVIAQDAFDEIQIAMEERGSFALLAALLDFVPGGAEEFDVGANFFAVGAASRGAHDEAPGITAAGFADKPAQTRAIIGASDFARDADVIDGRHVHEETSGQSDVTGDARTLLPEGLLGNLDDYILTGLEHFGNELRAARRASVMAMASLVPAIRARTAWSAGTALEALARASASAAAFGASATAIGTATAIIAAAITSAAAEGALETLARIAANARGVAREFFARRWGAACTARSASFSRQQDDVVLGNM